MSFSPLPTRYADQPRSPFHPPPKFLDQSRVNVYTSGREKVKKVDIPKKLHTSLDGTHVHPGVRGVYTKLRDDILGGRLRPGQVLNQVHLARELGVSRTPLREALRMLQAEGLVRSEHHR